MKRVRSWTEEVRNSSVAVSLRDGVARSSAYFRECVIVLCIIVIRYILWTLLSFVFDMCCK